MFSILIFLVDKEFIEERRRALKNVLQILSRHPIICESEILKFFLTFQGTVSNCRSRDEKYACAFDLGLWR